MHLVRDNAEGQAVGGKAWSLLMNSFVITGGTGPVDVTFQAALGGYLQLALDDPWGGQGALEAVYAMELDGQPLLGFRDQISVHQTLGDPQVSASKTIDAALSATWSLQYGTEYFFLSAVDNDPLGPFSVSEAPEPSAILSSILVALFATSYIAVRRLRRLAS
jgi:hypothetical protein